MTHSSPEALMLPLALSIGWVWWSAKVTRLGIQKLLKKPDSIFYYPILWLVLMLKFAAIYTIIAALNATQGTAGHNGDLFLMISVLGLSIFRTRWKKPLENKEYWQCVRNRMLLILFANIAAWASLLVGCLLIIAVVSYM